MLKDITIGQYYPADTPVHRLDPRMKIILVFLYIVAVFFVNSYLPFGLLAIYLLLVIRASKIPLGMILRGLKPLRFILIITFVINLFFTPGENLWSYGFLKISQEGVHQAIFMAIRLVLLVVGTSILTLTTSPIELTDGIEKLLSPLRVIGVPAHELAMMMTIALRFIPTLIDETDKIMKAQMARGADFESGNVLSRAKNLVPLLVPLFVNALRRAEELANAMESRCYRGGDHRTKLNELEFQASDFIISGVNLVFFILVSAYRYLV